ncbi:hypothetical protein A3K82_01905 [Candidatus Pacearchaeota archaeon RBG_19FT_COMBO_34_9]|nr:MAG: hypothetical protein A3K82_01905 [Candidatus Pacearchaeota archaeon RBG_19FT_COMBO_34_9]OGJ16736.1 MAG: hypothetical protein A3K74_00780 [Candidatus Pacearchaeota archaeon RBG_13_33_26]
MNKRGQFFLIAAVVIIVVVVSIVTIANFTQKKDDIKLYDLGEELGIESQQVLDYGTYNSLDDEEMKELMENFIENYVNYAGEGKNIYFIFGNKEKIYVIGYQDVLPAESVCVQLNPETDNDCCKKGQKCIDGRCEAGGICGKDEIQCGSNCCNLGERCVNGRCEAGGICGYHRVECSTPCIPLEVMGETQEFTTNGNIYKVVIRIGNTDYEFRLRYGENFYFVIWQKVGGETHVVTSGEE